MDKKVKQYYEDSKKSIAEKLIRFNDSEDGENYLFVEISKVNAFLLSKNLNHEYRKFVLDNFIGEA